MLSVETAREPVLAHTDQRRLKQVLLNLISNAINYNRPGGSITLRVVPDGPERARIDVIDTGVGMTAEQLSRLFNPFERLDAPLHGVEGNGLGLTVSKAMVEAMGGSIDVVSNPGVGSAFSLRLPAANAGAPPVQSRSDVTSVLARAA